MDRFKLLLHLLLLLLLLLASVVATRRHHSGGLWPDRGSDKDDDGRGPAWEARRNDWTNGTDLLDWSRDPRRVDPKVYDSYSVNCSFLHDRWPYTVTAQLEGQEWPAGLVKGDQVEPKSKAQLLACDGIRMYMVQDFPHPTTKYYLAENDIMLEREFSSTKCESYAKCPKRDNCATYRIDNPSETEYIKGSISGQLSGRMEQLLRDYGPMGVYFGDRLPLQLDERSFWNITRKCDKFRPLPTRIGPGSDPPYIGYRSFPQDSFLLVGYGRTDDGIGYFKFKTSLGPKWGDGGFGYLKYTWDQRRCAHLNGEIELWKIKPCGSGSSEGHSRYHKIHSHRVKSRSKSDAFFLKPQPM